MLFEVAILEHPTKKDKEENAAAEKLVYGPKFVVAKDAQTAGNKTMMGLSGLPAAERPEFDIDRAQVLIRPFA